jgi:hypothetical protein
MVIRRPDDFVLRAYAHVLAIKVTNIPTDTSCSEGIKQQQRKRGAI